MLNSADSRKDVKPGNLGIHYHLSAIHNSQHIHADSRKDLKPGNRGLYYHLCAIHNSEYIHWRIHPMLRGWDR